MTDPGPSHWNPQKSIFPRSMGLALAALVFGVLFFPDPRLFAGDLAVHHRLAVRLFPETHRLTGSDEMVIRRAKTGVLEIHLAENSVISNVQVDGHPARFSFHGGRLRVYSTPTDGSGSFRVTVTYLADFNDPVPVRPVNTDNPGYGVTGTVSENGTFLLAGAGWYPEVMDARSTYELEVTAPAGILAVTAGKSLAHTTTNDVTVSTWRITRPVEGLSLSAARYIVTEKKVGTVTAATYFFPESEYLAEKYLDATARYITLYEKMFGPYPFDKFAVVENFFPTGFGFPSYTLLGSRVLRLPFIIHTSLGHEIAHCWWGNGVLVDTAAGNWCEGLTSYVADYLYRESASENAALAHRRQLLRNYADLVDPAQDFPLTRFRSRYDRITKAVGYDKCAMVFHMLRRRLGEDAFWGGLRDLYTDRLFQPTTWEDLRKSFERRGRVSLKGFFNQWISRPGAVRLSLADVSAESTGRGWTVSGRILQQPPFYDVDMDLAVETGDRRTVVHTVTLSGAATPFKITVDMHPLRLSVDPGYHLFRRLYPCEIPPSVNTLKGSDAVLVVAPAKPDAGIRASADLLVRALGLNHCQWIEANQLTGDRMAGNDLVFIGLPKDRGVLSKAPVQVVLEDQSFTLNGKVYNGPGDVFFGVFAHPMTENRVVAVFHPLSPEQADKVALKITHYGKYSYLVFSGGRNRVKGTWPVVASPLIYQWNRK